MAYLFFAPRGPECEAEILNMTEARNPSDPLRQFRLNRELEIYGIDERYHVDLTYVTHVIGILIGVNVVHTDLDYVFRLAYNRRNHRDYRLRVYPRPIVVRFVSIKKRNEFLKAGKMRRHLNSIDIGMRGPPRSVFIYERLTNVKRRLYLSARRRYTRAGYEYCWVHKGNVLIRQHAWSAAIVLESMHDMHLYLGS